MKIHHLLFPAALLFACGMLHAAEELCRFDTTDALDRWRNNTPPGRLTTGREPAARGRGSLSYEFPKWREKKQENDPSVWPSFELRPTITDWSRFDRLAVRVFNASQAPVRLVFQIRDTVYPAKTAVFKYFLPPLSDSELVLPIAAELRAQLMSPSSIRLLHIVTYDPQADLKLHLSGFTLLEPGEAVPAPSTAYRDAVTAQIEAGRRAWRDVIRKAYRNLPKQELSATAAALLNNRFRTLMSCDDSQALLNAVNFDCSGSLTANLRAFDRQRASLALTSAADGNYLGFAHTSDKVLPRDPVYRPLPAVVELAAARNEREGFQLIVLPAAKNLADVKVTVEPLRSGENTLPAAAAEVLVVGYVRTSFASDGARGSYIGWWPDLLLSFLESVPVARGDAQSFLIRFRIPENQPPGLYRGAATVTIDGQPAFWVPLALRVYNFTLPRRPTLRLAVGFVGVRPSVMPMRNRRAWMDQPDFPANIWKKHYREWVDMFADYGINIDNIYNFGNGVQFEALARLRDEGRLNSFNLGEFQPASASPEHHFGMQSTIDRIRRNYDRARQLGLLEYAYIYGCDEVNPDKFDRVEQAAAILKKEFPDIPILTTAVDPSLGTDGRLRSIDIFCPRIDRFIPELAEKARRNGKRVWWYICNYPWPPYAGAYVESEGIGLRLLLGAQSVKYGIEGFLYYSIGNWNNRRPVTSGPFTDWNPNSYFLSNGDGGWTAVGPDGIPLATLRLENFRDGLEDHAYAELLKRKIAVAANADWKRRAETAVEVPDGLVHSLTTYSRSPEQLQAWRARLAELLEEKN